MKSEAGSSMNESPVERTKGISRREVLQNICGAIAAAGLAPWRASPAHASPGASGIKVAVPSVPAMGTGKSSFFSPVEKEMVATVADLIIPTDDISPGARAAGVHDWIDFVVANSPPEVHERWREGLATLDRASEESAGRKFLQLDAEHQRALLAQFAEREEAPVTAEERFFALAKEATVNGYYTSEIGLMKDLKFKGGTYVAGPETSCPASAAGPHVARPEHGAPKEEGASGHETQKP